MSELPTRMESHEERLDYSSDSDSDHLTKAEKEEAKRKKSIETRKQIVKEFVTTERNYIGYLNKMLSKYLHPMEKEGVIKPGSELRSLLGSFPVFIKKHEKLLKYFQAGDMANGILSEKTTTLQLYSYFFKRYDQLRDFIDNTRASDKKFNQFILDRGDDIELYYSAPTFRLPRYVLLLKELIKHTPEDHDEYGTLI
eukprot:UN26463